MVLLYVFNLGRKKEKAENTKIYKLQQRYLRDSDSSLQQGATLTNRKPHTLTPLNLAPTSLNQTDVHAMRISAALQRYKTSVMTVCLVFPR